MYRIANQARHHRGAVAHLRTHLQVGKTCAAVLVAALLAPSVRAAETEDKEGVAEVIVTGTRLGSVNASTPAPVVVVDSQELAHQGTARAEDLLNSLPQVNSGLTLGANGPSVAPLTGTATADLRGIGAFRTLVLINGRRTAPGDPINPSADLNTIPTALVKRVEVLTGGASAIYGSDAVAGVVNFILDSDFDGFKLNIEDGGNYYRNNRGDLQDIARASGVNPRTGSGLDGSTLDVSAVFGKALFEGKGHVSAYAGYRHAQAVAGSMRDFSACTLAESGTSFQCLPDATTANGQFVAGGGTGPALTLDSTGHAFRALTAGDLYNPAPFQTLQRPEERYLAGGFASYSFSEAVTLYAEAQYMRDTTQVAYEPSGTTATGAGLNVFMINCADPQLSASQVTDLCGSPLAPTANVAIGRRNAEGGPRTDEFRHDSFRVVAGVKGELSEPWSYDTSALYGRVNGRETLSNDVSLSRVSNALNVVNAGGVPTCQSVIDGSDPNCVPYNIFSAGGVTPAALKYISEGGVQSGFAERTILNGQVVGELGHYGITSPLAHSGVGVAAGVEYRREAVRYNPSPSYASGDLLVTGTTHPTEGSFHVEEIFAEMKFPLVEDRPFVKDLLLNVSDRYARYTPQGNVNAYGIGLEWAPVTQVRLRGSVSRAVRAPNAYELFTSRVLGQINFTDPCAGATPSATLTACERSGVTPAQYGNVPAATAINVLTGGNPDLHPETANTTTIGFVLTPTPNLLFSADFWRIKVKQYVGGLPGPFTVTTCLNTGDPYYCGLVQRDANGSLSTGNGAGAGRVIATRFNTGSYGNSGADFEGRYALGMQSAGMLSFSFTGSLALDNPIDVTPGVPELDCTGLFGPNCSGAGPTSPVPRWRHRLRTTWQATSAVELSLNWRYIGRLKSEFTNGNPNLYNPANIFPVDSEISAYNYFDLDAAVDVTKSLNVRAGINNLTGKNPPVIGFVANPLLVNGNMAAGMYDTLGRFVFVALTAKY